MEWTAEKKDLLNQYFNENKSMAEIAALIEGATRNAVIGAVHRLGLARSERQPKPKSQKPPKQRIQRPRFGSIAPLPPLGTAKKFVPRPGKAADNPCNLLELRWNTCRWPYGDPKHADFHFCGGVSVDGKPYCRDHLKCAAG